MPVFTMTTFLAVTAALLLIGLSSVRRVQLFVSVGIDISSVKNPALRSVLASKLSNRAGGRQPPVSAGAGGL